jgi:hypothetical protein
VQSMTDNYVSKGLRGEAFKREHPINQADWAPILEEVLGLIQTLDEKMKLLRVAASFDAGKGQPFCAHVEVPKSQELVGSLLNLSCGAPLVLCLSFARLSSVTATATTSINRAADDRRASYLMMCSTSHAQS